MAVLLWLTPIVPPSSLLLVALHTRTQLDVNTWWSGKTEALGHFDKIEFVHVEDGAQAVRSIGLQVGSVAVFR